MADIADSSDIDRILKKKPSMPSEAPVEHEDQLHHEKVDEADISRLDDLVQKQRDIFFPKGPESGVVSHEEVVGDPLNKVTQKVQWPAREQPQQQEEATPEKKPAHTPEPQKMKQHIDQHARVHVHHVMTSGDKLRFVVLRSIGNFLLLFSIYGVLATFGPTLYYEATFRVSQARGIKYTVAEKASDLKPDPTVQVVSDGTGPSLGSVLSGSTEQVLVPPDSNFSIVISKIGASARVFPNVETENEKEFLPILQQGVAHAKGTVFPGLPGNIYLFAHSTDNWWNVGRYNAVFYLLKDLQPGDDIVLFFEGRRHNYVVSHSLIADPSEVSYLTNAQKGEEQLVLQTCWPPGTTWKRYFVFAKPKISI